MVRPREQAYCKDCGQPCDRKGRWDHGWRCINCRIGRHAEATRQINARRGEYYEKWVAGLAASVARAQAMIEAYRSAAD